MYKRIVLKLSGEALAGEKKGVTFDDSIIWGLIAQIKAVMAKGTQVSLVIGGGNFWRGRSADSKMDRTKADQIGMLATVMNAIYVADAFRQNDRAIFQGKRSCASGKGRSSNFCSRYGTPLLLYGYDYCPERCRAICGWSVLCQEH